MKIGAFLSWDGRSYHTAAQYAAAMDAYERLESHYGDDPNGIADHLGWSRGTGCVIRRMARERRA